MRTTVSAHRRFDYEYDAAANVTGATRALDSTAQVVDPGDTDPGAETLARTFSYDNLNRLASSTMTGPVEVGAREMETVTESRWCVAGMSPVRRRARI